MGYTPHLGKGRTVMGSTTFRAGHSSGHRGRLLMVAVFAIASVTGAMSMAAAPAGAVSSPTITQVSPNSLPQGASNTPVTLTGTNFQSGAKVASHSGIKAKVAFVSATQLNLSVTVAATVAPGAYNLNLTNPDGGKFHCANCLTVTSTSPPTVTSVSPTSLNQNST